MNVVTLAVSGADKNVRSNSGLHLRTRLATQDGLQAGRWFVLVTKNSDIAPAPILLLLQPQWDGFSLRNEDLSEKRSNNVLICRMMAEA